MRLLAFAPGARSRLSLQQALPLVAAAINVMAMLALAFAPIVLFFLITAPRYNFYKVLNVAVLGLTGLIGVMFLLRGMRGLNLIARAKEPTASAQLAWTSRPFLGSPDEEAAVLRSIDGNFYVDIVRTLANLFS